MLSLSTCHAESCTFRSAALKKSSATITAQTDRLLSYDLHRRMSTPEGY
uniref:Uncharacterized protein n=1 Tax=Arundo donax TaxID=35708 RepID=A0A0A9C9D4_ARUDO